MIAPVPHTREATRLSRLRGLGILETPAEEAFDRITRIASRLFGVPIALVSLIDEKRQWFKSRVGLDVAETARDISFCGHAVAEDAMLVVEDAAGDPRFADNPLVLGAPGIRFYAGAPLRSSDDLPLGTLCVIDRAARSFGPAERALLLDLAGLAEAELRRYRVLDEVARNLSGDRQLRTLLWLLPDAAFACNPGGEIVTANPAARELFGRRIRDMLGQPAASLFADLPPGPWPRGLETGVVRQCVRGDATTFPGRVNWRRLEIEDAELGIFTVRDVSQWLERERRLAEQAQLLDMARDAIIVTDTRNVVTFWSRGAETMYGIARADAVGREMASLVSPRASPQRAERFAEVLHGGGYWEGDLEHQRADGTPITVFSRWSTLRGKGGEALSVLKINTDVTARKEVEQMKNEFVSVVNHELRTPLTSILGSLELLLTYPEDEIGAEPRSLLEVGRRNTERLVRLVNDVLDIEKIESGKMNYRWEEVDVRDVAQEAIECVRGAVERHQVRIEVAEGATGETRVVADRDRLVQVLTNLLSNAVKFSPRGERVSVAIARQADTVRVSVIDRGPGIPPGFGERIFERFAQVESPETRHAEGTGLGLAICKGIMEALKGSIGFRSVPGQGATFYIELAAVPAKPARG